MIKKKTLAKFNNLEIAMNFIHRKKYSDNTTSNLPENQWYEINQKFCVSRLKHAYEFLEGEFHSERITDSPQQIL